MPDGNLNTPNIRLDVGIRSNRIANAESNSDVESNFGVESNFNVESNFSVESSNFDVESTWFL